MYFIALNRYVLSFFIVFSLFGCAKKKNLQPKKQKAKIVNYNKRFISTPEATLKRVVSILKPIGAVNNNEYIFISNINRVRMNPNSCSNASTQLLYNRKLEFAAKSYPNKYILSFLDSNASVSNNKSFLQRVKDFGYILKANRPVSELLAFTKYKVTQSNDIDLNFKHALENLIKNPQSCKLLMNPKFKDVGVAFKRTNLGYYWIIELAGGEN